MSLAVGARLGPYEIRSALGRGGMGEVYRARDDRLGRDVAIKVLPASFSADPDRLRRFEQEARAAAALNHPNILAVYDIGTHDGGPYVVSELLEGTTLRAALAAGALPVRKALDYAIQIGNGLAAAHDKGVVHRDLKPENLFITRDGRVKILDFGLAKLTEAAMVAGAGAGVSMIATHTVDTTPGLVMGTVGYMSPEQVRGQVVDRRSDLFSFGAIFYEMLSGDRAFTGATAADTMSAILTKEPPDLTATHGEVPPTLERVIRHCLEKTPEQRFQSAGDLVFALAALSEGSSSGAVRTTASSIRSLFRWRERMAWIAVACFAIALLPILWTARRVPTMGPEGRFSVPLPEKTTFRGLALSPDGTTLAFVARTAEGVGDIVLRPLDGLASRVLAGTDEAVHPFWSPDSRYLAFCQKGKLKKIALAGGAPETLCDCPYPNSRGAWSRDGYIVFAPAFNLPLSKVADTGGPMSPVTAYAPSGVVNPLHASPILLPDGRHLLYSISHYGPTAVADPDGIFIASLDSTATSRLVRAPLTTLAIVNGHLLYQRGQTLVAQPFDTRALALTGEPITLAEDVGPLGAFDAVPGVLAYTTDSPSLQLTWFDRGGRSLGSMGERRLLSDPRLSPDGTRLAFSLADVTGGSIAWDIWIADLGRDVETRLTFTGLSMSEIWSPDSGRIAFNTLTNNGIGDLFEKAANGGGSERLLFSSDHHKFPWDWSPDGRFLAYSTPKSAGPQGAGENMDLWILPVSGDRKPIPFVTAPSSGAHARFSPDGRWVSYASGESGRMEIYVKPFPGPGGKIQVSPAGGDEPVWRRDGRELFYRDPARGLMAVEIARAGTTLAVGRTRALFATRMQSLIANGYDVSADGQRFIIASESEQKSGSITVVMNPRLGGKK